MRESVNLGEECITRNWDVAPKRGHLRIGHHTFGTELGQ